MAAGGTRPARRLPGHQVRRQAIARIRRRLEQNDWPRMEMSLLVALTGLAGFLASFGLLQAGLESMVLRYPVALLLAYLVFLVLLWDWVRRRGKADFHGDVPQGWPDSSGDIPPPFQGGGGEFGGGGAGGRFDAGSASPGLSPEPECTEPGVLDEGVGQVMGAAAEADELAIPLLAVMLILALLGALFLSSLLVVYSAPALFAELVVDGVLSASLYHRLRGLETRHWLETAVRYTAWPFVLTAAALALCGWGMQRYAPQADSIGEVIAQAAAHRGDVSQPR